MQLKIGKYYRTRNGEKAGPVEHHNGGGGYVFKAKLNGLVRYYALNGEYFPGQGIKHRCDLISEWVDEPASPQSAGPVRTITRKEIVPGSYKGPVHIYEADNNSVRLSVPGFHYKLIDLKNIIETLTEIADAMEENQK